MANTQPAQFSYTLQDELGTKASQVIYAMVDPTATIATLSTQWQAMGALIDAITGGKIVNGAVNVIKALSGGKSDPASGSRVEQTGVFNFFNVTTPRRFGEAVPSLSDTVIVSGEIDLGDADVAAFVTAMTASFTTGVNTNTAEQALSSLADAFLSFRKRRRQLTRSTYEVP